MAKNERQRLILSIISREVVETQDDLVRLLRAHGQNVTQATVSRDIKELRLAKVATVNGGYRYALPQLGASGEKDPAERVKKAFDEYVISLDYSQNLVVLQTLPGTAPAVAAAIDTLEINAVLATLAGDDTILVITKDENSANKLQSQTAVSVYNYLIKLKKE